MSALVRKPPLLGGRVLALVDVEAGWPEVADVGGEVRTVAMRWVLGGADMLLRGSGIDQGSRIAERRSVMRQMPASVDGLLAEGLPIRQDVVGAA